MPNTCAAMTPTHRRIRLEWCRAGGYWTAAEWNQVVFSDESRFNLICDDNRVRVWRPRGERLNPAFSLQRHITPTAGVMVWSHFSKRQCLASHSHGKSVTRLSPPCYYPSLACLIPRFVSNPAYLGLFRTITGVSFERQKRKAMDNAVTIKRMLCTSSRKENPQHAMRPADIDYWCQF
ncbi:transposable element Tcb1 transposase [Trichonephila clavipes]|uniref:Transposable element Tcb1 transposase n=1 Tax=Trichonephila clavipes TaxID=2585209 RepID=A0A8X6V8X3_TRICX|nr:transposable element Tcb1 transposase [Trichonephila clavipes]